MQTDKEITKVDALVRDILRNDVRARNDDKYLTCRVMQRLLGQKDNRLIIEFADFPLLPAFETIKRARAYIQNIEGLYPPTDTDVFKARCKRSAMFRQHFAMTDLFT